ncbi:MAG: GNAT family N-acetyltransferase [Saprospiraceae bacterium]|nr:GNAT family N-acetyltransferase [Saprospiraceae bacterium]MBK6565863.1 GNAT family N-acetyltransferase [Saprospiraceae bacterium]MBK8370126.1 GNAT family N-acetyltransferase [Saprospiraceae bacterium]MBK8817987.1 GNAT family N-acetyltransferase [Saprospiraceae bacterium]MBP6693821.1 GNAT family N-acetyltransferase [Saprospiraceae bacterium]
MIFPTSYKAIKKQIFSHQEYNIVPIRYEDRMLIKNWRNEQLFHLRQQNLLSDDDQNNYFKSVVFKLFDEKNPDQILFSYLHNKTCIGYGGLVHINWIDKHAEISFLMDTSLEEVHFEFHWKIFLCLIEKVAFSECKLHKIFTYAFDLRPRLYPVILSSGFYKEATLKHHCFIDNKWKDVVIHAKLNFDIKIRNAVIQDVHDIYEWVNDPDTRKYSFNTNLIVYSDHIRWFEERLSNNKAWSYIGEVNGSKAAFIRIDKHQNGFVIGINLNPEFRGLRLSKSLLNAAISYFEEPGDILAFIKPENKVSIASFEGIGFTFSGKTKVGDSEALEYKLIKNE